MNHIIKLENRCSETELKTLMADLLNGSLGGVDVELDFSSVENPDMRSIQLLMSWSNSFSSTGGSVKTSGVSDKLNRFFEKTGTTKLVL